MRKGRRKILLALGLLLFMGPALGAPGDLTPGGAAAPVRLTIEVSWTVPEGVEAGAAVAATAGGVELEVSEGRVVDALAWPSGVEPEARGERVWRLGASDRAGRVRARIEAAVGANLVVRAAGQAMQMPAGSLLDGPQRTPFTTPVEIVVERVAWDSLSVSLGGADANGNGQGGDGVVAPGTTLPLNVGLNVVTPEPAQVIVRCTAELRPLRGGEAIWQHEWREMVGTNAAMAATSALPVRMPDDEGLYVLDLHAAWEPATVEEKSHLIGRLIHRGRKTVSGGAGSASRRVTLAVVGPTEPGPRAASSRIKAESEQEVDSLDLTRARGNRAWAAGRSLMAVPGRATWPVPDGALVEATRRDRLKGWITRVGPEVAQLGPADAKGLAWSAVGLKVAHPGRPHRLSLTVAGGYPAALGVAVVGPAGAAPGQRPRLLLDACASGPPILPEGGPHPAFSWLIWPDTVDPVLVLVNRATGSPVQVGAVTLTELPELPPGPAIEEPGGTLTRGLGLALTGADVLERFGAAAGVKPGQSDTLTAARNLARYAAHCGASSVLLSEGLSDRPRRRALDGQAAEDAVGPDRLDLALRVLGRQGIAAWLELGFAGALPGLPAPGSPEALTRGLVRLDRRGQVDGPLPTYHPLTPEVGDALRRKLTEAIAAHQAAPTTAGGTTAGAKLSGVLVRLGPGPTLLGTPDSGFDDATFGRFVKESFDAETARGLPGVAGDDPERFAARARFLAGSGRMPWLTWRSRQVAALYSDLTAAAAKAAPGVALVVVTPGLGESPAASEARRADLAGLAPSLAWRAVGLDLDAWPAGEHPPIVLRGVCLSPDDLAHDLATSPELDAKVAACPARGLLVDLEDAAGWPGTWPGRPGTGLGLTALPLDSGRAGDEPLGHALAALDARWVLLSAPAVAGHEERLRRFARVFRALPATAPTESDNKALAAFGVTVRAHAAEGKTYLALANDTPFPVRLDTVLNLTGTAVFDDLGRTARLRPEANAAGHHLVLDLLPFGVAAVRVGAADVKVASVVPYPSDAVLTSLQASYDEVSAQLSRLGRKVDAEHTGPPNPTFEPPAIPAPTPPSGPRAVAMSVGSNPTPPATSAPPAPEGWQLVGGKGSVSIDLAQPHSGRGSLRLDVPQLPGSAVCDPFAPGVHTSMLVRAWLRADHPDARLRLWIEAESGGQPYRRVSELTAQPAWTERAIRAGDIPAAGLDAVRLRFELLTPGSLWIDDLNVTGGSLSDPERRNARNTLLAAIQAYREKRYADFARLAGSHWARVAVTPGRPTSLVGGGAEGTGTLRTGDASALPQGRRLR